MGVPVCPQQLLALWLKTTVVILLMPLLIQHPRCLLQVVVCNHWTRRRTVIYPLGYPLRTEIGLESSYLHTSLCSYNNLSTPYRRWWFSWSLSIEQGMIVKSSECLRIHISSFVDSKCWLHFKFDMQLRTDQTVTQYYNCKNGPLPISTEDPLTGNDRCTTKIKQQRIVGCGLL